jgi:hypothetical protein
LRQLISGQRLPQILKAAKNEKQRASHNINEIKIKDDEIIKSNEHQKT